MSRKRITSTSGGGFVTWIVWERPPAVNRQRAVIDDVKGITVTCVKGFGEYANYFSRSWMCEHARIELFIREDEVDSIVEMVMEVAHTGASGDGMVAVLPVEAVYRIRTKRPATADEV